MSRSLGPVRVLAVAVVAALALSLLAGVHDASYAGKKRKKHHSFFQVSSSASACLYNGGHLSAIVPASPRVKMRKTWAGRHYSGQYVKVTMTAQGLDGAKWRKIKGSKRAKIFKVRRANARKWKTAPAIRAFTGAALAGNYAQYRVRMKVIWYRPDNGRADVKRKAAITSYSHGTSCPAVYVRPTVVDVEVGDYHACAVMSDTTVRCWGSGSNGRLGTGNTDRQPWPVTVPGLAGVRSLAVGQSHTCAVMGASKAAYCWGYNKYGQLGDGTTTDRLLPTPVKSLPGAADVWSTYNTTCATSSGQPLKCWGLNNYGQLDTGTTTNSATPVAIAGLTSMIDAGTGSQFACSARSTGLVYCWGRNQVGQKGTGSATTTVERRNSAVSGVSSASAVATGDAHACAVIANGAVKCWGYNNYGQLGNGANSNSATPVAVKNVSGATALSASYLNTCVIVSGAARCWGNNSYGQLGLGNQTSYNTPQTVPGLSNLVGISVGVATVCAWDAAGAVWCWGRNTYGQLGRGFTSDFESRPALVGGL